MTPRSIFMKPYKGPIFHDQLGTSRCVGLDNTLARGTKSPKSMVKCRSILSSSAKVLPRHVIHIYAVSNFVLQFPTLFFSF